MRDPTRDPQYTEPQLDAMRAQKDQVATPLTHSLYCPIVTYYYGATIKNLTIKWSVEVAFIFNQPTKQSWWKQR